LEVNGLSYRLVDDLPEHYQTVTPQDIQREANAYFVKSNLTTLNLEPEQEK
ncbi:insulinase family protein, partial [Acinetobacter ursingii]